MTHRARRLTLIVALVLLAAGPVSAAEPIRIGFMGPDGVAVLDVQAGGVPEDPGL